MKVEAAYFDGRSARRHAVTLEIDGDHACVRGESVDRRERLADLRVSEPMGAAPRVVTFPDGATCEVRDHAGFARLLRATGYRDSAVVRWQFDIRLVLLALLVVAASGWIAYRHGLPAAARAAAQALPQSVLDEVGASVLQTIDGRLLEPTRLPEARREAIAARFRDLAGAAAPGLAWRIHFRSGPLGPNALALPSGDIIVTDALVEVAGSDERVVAVLVHELGHVARRHGMQHLLQSSVVGLAAAWFLGDFGSVLASAPALLVELQYSRALELEADDYAARVLRAHGASPMLLAEMLARLEQASGEPRRETGSRRDYLSTHPATAERIARLREAAGAPRP